VNGTRRSPPHPDWELFGRGGETVWDAAAVLCDYGTNILLASGSSSLHCVVLDVCVVRVGDFTLFARRCKFYHATHPLNANYGGGRKYAMPVRSGRMCGSAAGRSFAPACGSARRRHRGGERGHEGHPGRGVGRRDPCRVIREITD